MTSGATAAWLGTVERRNATTTRNDAKWYGYLVFTAGSLYQAVYRSCATHKNKAQPSIGRNATDYRGGHYATECTEETWADICLGGTNESLIRRLGYLLVPSPSFSLHSKYSIGASEKSVKAGRISVKVSQPAVHLLGAGLGADSVAFPNA
jgi:hypothetical protein